MKPPLFSAGCFMVALAMASLGWADIHVEDAAGGVSIRADTDKVAVFQPTAQEVWVVSNEAGAVEVAESVAGRTGWETERLRVSGGSGVRITSPKARSWTVRGKAGAWKVVQGQPQGGQASMVLLREGLAGELAVADTKGRRFYVVPSEHGRSGKAEGLLATAHGVARPASEFSAIEPAAGDVGTVTAPQQVAAVDSRQVPFTDGPVLKGVATPVAENAAQVEDLPVPVDELAVAAQMVYVPGTVVSFTLPEGYRLERGQLLRDSFLREDTSQQLGFARAYGAVQAAALRAEEVANGVQEVVEAPVERSAVVEPVFERETEAEQVAVSVMEAPVEETVAAPLGDALFPEVGAASRYWPGVKQHLVRLSAAMERAGALVPESTEGGLMWQRTPQDIAVHPDVMKARRALVAYYLAWGRPHEAETELAFMPQENGLPAHAKDRFYLALSKLLQRQPQEALALLKADDETLPVDRLFWQATALQQTGRSAEALRTWPNQGGVLPRYPAFMRELILLSRAEALVGVGDREQAKAFIDSVAGNYPEGKVPATWLRLQGVVRMGTREEQRGLELLALAAADTADPYSAYRAKYDFVQALLRRGELENRQVTAYLEDLRLYWRGDRLEQQVLYQLGDYYMKQHDYRRALARWRTLVREYPDTPQMAALTDKMTDAVVGAFDPENPEQYDALTYLGLYFDFKELLPADARGDYAMERAGRLLAESGLPERAIPVLRQVLQFRATEPIDQARVALMLAESYTANGRPGEALKTLDEYKPKAVNTVQQKVWPLAEARALLALNRPDAALEALNGSYERQSAFYRAEAAWQKSDWDYLVDMLAPLVARFRASDLPHDLQKQVAVLRLAYAYGQQQQREELAGLLERFGSVARSLPTMADSLSALATQAGVPDRSGADRPLAQVAEALGGLNAFTDTFKQRQRDVQEQREEREEFNNKMRYMELLPPPIL